MMGRRTWLQEVRWSRPREPIADPWFTALEILILAMMPFMVTLMVSVHAWSARETKAVSMVAVVFMALVAVITSVDSKLVRRREFGSGAVAMRYEPRLGRGHDETSCGGWSRSFAGYLLRSGCGRCAVHAGRVVRRAHQTRMDASI